MNMDCIEMTGRDYAQEGRRFARVLYPKARDRKANARRLLRRAEAFIHAPDERVRGIGFFLFGLSEACRGRRGHEA